MNEQELNRKLAEWAGFKHYHIPDTPHMPPLYIWIQPDSTEIYSLPNFLRSLDACFEWLVPKLEPLGYELEISNDAQMLGWRVSLHNQYNECSLASPYEQYSEPSGTALALCLAIEKLIDGGSK